MTEPLEIERKYLIRRPDPAVLAGTQTYTMEQTYLTAPEGITARVRRRFHDGQEEFFYTEKEHRTAVTCVEREKRVDRETYECLLTRRRSDSRTICKTRCCLMHEGLVFEIDIYPFWEQIAVMEVELSCEEQVFTLPPQITVIREVSGDKRLKNAALARCIPEEEDLL
ncbi:MAG: hypothetical protein KBS74_07435 [Clostridiales bacterium]|nr:hypothetical protein [Candidatus Cacconaster stercorequi]